MLEATGRATRAQQQLEPTFPGRGEMWATHEAGKLGSLWRSYYWRRWWAAGCTIARTSKQLTEKDTVVLTDFANSTGDQVFDDTLKQALAAVLDQSPFLNILPEKKVRQELELMSQPSNAKVTPELAQESASALAAREFWRVPSRGSSSTM